MNWPKGLEFTDGFATDGKHHYFVCQKKGHGRIAVRDTDGARLRRLAKDHNNVFHTIASRLLPAILSRGEASITTVNDALAGLERQLNDRERQRIIVSRTVDEKMQSITMLRRYLTADELAIDIERCGKAVAVRYAGRRRDSGTTGGARIRKELQTLLKAASVAGVTLNWTLRSLDDSESTLLKAEARDWRPITIAEAMRWISNMAEPEKSLALVKFYSGGSRDTDLFAQTVRNVSFADGGWTISLHKKYRGKVVEHWQPLEPECMDILARICKGKSPDSLVFTTPSGLPMSWKWLEYRLAQSSVRAGLPRMKRFGWIFRHLAITYLVWKLGPREAQKYIGHSSVTMTERYDRPELFREVGLALKAERRGAASAMGELVAGVPLGEPVMIGPARGMRRAG